MAPSTDRARARDSSRGIASGSIRISCAGRSTVRVSSTVMSPSPGLINRPKNRNPSPRTKTKHRPLAHKAAQREPAGRISLGRGPFRTVARLEDLDAGHRLALPIHDPAADGSQRSLDHGEQDPRFVADGDPVREDRLHPR